MPEIAIPRFILHALNLRANALVIRHRPSRFDDVPAKQTRSNSLSAVYRCYTGTRRVIDQFVLFLPPHPSLVRSGSRYWNPISGPTSMPGIARLAGDTVSPVRRRPCSDGASIEAAAGDDRVEHRGVESAARCWLIFGRDRRRARAGDSLVRFGPHCRDVSVDAGRKAGRGLLSSLAFSLP